VVFLTVGTGIGGAVVIGGKLFNGFANRGTELGHVPLIANGEPCACGSVGCLEHYASTSALVRRFSKRAAEAGISFPGEEILWKSAAKASTKKETSWQRNAWTSIATSWDTASPDSSTSSARNAS
jgi:predicted NBD/HSP70 family sugar kinase